MAKLDGNGVTAVLTADTAVNRGANLFTELNCHIHELTNTGLVEFCKGIVLVDLGVIVRGYRHVSQYKSEEFGCCNLNYSKV